MMHIILSHISADIDDYKGFYTGDVSIDAETFFFKFGPYNRSLVDSIMAATHVLHLRLIERSR